MQIFQFLRSGESTTLKIRAESQESCAVIAKEVKQAIRMANASQYLIVLKHKSFGKI